MFYPLTKSNSACVQEHFFIRFYQEYSPPLTREGVEKITAIHDHGTIINKINMDGQVIMLWYGARFAEESSNPLCEKAIPFCVWMDRVCSQFTIGQDICQ